MKTAFARLHPADLHRVLQPARARPRPAGPPRGCPRPSGSSASRPTATSSSTRALPRSPWWLLPGLGDASVTFETRKHGELTFAVSSAEAEDLSLFDRAKRRQICLYTSGGRQPPLLGGRRPRLDLLHLDLAGPLRARPALPLRAKPP